MTDIEKVLKGLECHQIDEMWWINCADCPYYIPDCTMDRCLNVLHKDAIELLKSQQAEIAELKAQTRPGFGG